MIDTLKLFTTSSLFDATSALLGKLNIRFNRQTADKKYFSSKIIAKPFVQIKNLS